MSKKDFKGGLDSLLGETPTVGRGRPKGDSPAQAREATKTSQEGTKPSETRATFIVNEDQLEKLKAIAYWDRLMIKDVVAKAFEEYLKGYEKKNGEIKTPGK